MLNHERRLLAVLRDDRGDADLIRYAAALARLNAGAGTPAREVGAVPPGHAGGLPPPADTGGGHGLARARTDDGKEIVLRAAAGLRFVYALPWQAPGRPRPDRQQIVRRLRSRVEAALGGAAAHAAVRCDVLDGPALGALREAAAEEGSEVLLVGKGDPLAGRLAREAACPVWVVPDRPGPSFRRILVPVDFTARAADSLRVATALTRLAGTAECLALHVYFHDCLVPTREGERRVREQLRDRFARFLANVDCLGVPVTPLLREGASPARVIHRAAEEEGADLIVMGSRGRTGAGALLLPSVAAQALRTTALPLLVVKHFGARMGAFGVLTERAFWENNAPRFN